MFQTGGNLSKYQHEEALLHSKIQTRFKTALYPYLLWNYSITANQPKRAHGVNIATLFLATAMKLESTHTTTPTAMRWGITHACASVSIFVYAYFDSAQTLIKWQRISCGCSNSHHTHSTPICHNMDHRQVSHQVPPPPTPSTCIYISLYAAFAVQLDYLPSYLCTFSKLFVTCWASCQRPRLLWWWLICVGAHLLCNAAYFFAHMYMYLCVLRLYIVYTFHMIYQINLLAGCSVPASD